MPTHCHKLIAETAKDMARAAYEERASHSNHFYEKFPSMEEFVDDCWMHFIETARHTLAVMLGGPYRQELKESIYDALIKDQSIRRGRHLQVHPKDL
jgi:hypothetical protein